MTELLGDIDMFDQGIISDEDLQLSQFQEMEIEKSQIDYGQNSIRWQQFRCGISSFHAQYCLITGEIEVIFSVLLFLFKINYKF